VGGEDCSYIAGYAPGGTKPVVTNIDVSFGYSPQSLAFDVSNDLYVIDDPYEPEDLEGATSALVDEFPAAGTATALEWNFNDPIALAVDPFKHLYVLDFDSRLSPKGEHIHEYQPQSTVLMRTMESSGTAIGLSGVP
jgi:hypothetical protein